MQIVRSDRAHRDLLQIYNYIAERNPRAAENLLKNLDAKLKTLAHFPFIGRDRSSLARGLRSFVVHPYVVFYLVESDKVTLVRVIGGRRDIDEEFQR